MCYNVLHCQLAPPDHAGEVKYNGLYVLIHRAWVSARSTRWKVVKGRTNRDCGSGTKNIDIHARQHWAKSQMQRDWAPMALFETAVWTVRARMCVCLQ